MDFEKVEIGLKQAWSLSTSSKWTAANPALGQCSVTVLVLQDIFGGDILKTNVDGAWHFYNLVDDRVYDFTSSQFSVEISYNGLPATQTEALADTSPEQYQELRKRFTEVWKASS